MKVRVTITLDVDPDAWAHEFGVAREDVRDDVREYFETIAHAQLRDVLGLHQVAATREP